MCVGGSDGRVVGMAGQPAILVAYATKKGSTREVAEEIGGALVKRGLLADVRPASEVRSLEPYTGVVLGGALYTGRWHGDARALLKRHARALERIPLAVFAIGPKTLEEGDVAGARAQLDAALARTPTVTPTLTAIFGVSSIGEVAVPLLTTPCDRRTRLGCDSCVRRTSRVVVGAARRGCADLTSRARNEFRGG